MRHVQRRAAIAGVQVEQGQTARKQLAKDDALGEPRRQAKADALGKLLEEPADVAFVAGVETGEPVAHDDPVDGAAIGQSAPLALLPDRLSIDTGALDLLALAIEAGQQIEVEKTVVQRRDQDVRVSMADAR